MDFVFSKRLLSALKMASAALAVVAALGIGSSAYAATCTFSSTVDNDWNNSANWSGCGGVTPTSADDVVIPASTSTSLSANGYANNITIGAGSTLDLNGHSVGIYGDWTDNGTLVGGGISTVMFLGSGTQHIGPEANFRGVSIQQPGGSVVLTGNITTQFLYFASAAGSALDLNGKTLTISGSGTGASIPFDYASGVFTPNGGKVVYSGTANTDIENGITYGDVEFVGTGTYFLIGSTHVGSVTIGPAATLDQDGSTLYVTGSWTDSGTLVSVGSTVIFDGTGTQTVNTEAGFHGLTIQKPSGSLVLAGDVTTTYMYFGSVDPSDIDLNGKTLTISGSGTGGSMPFDYVSGVWNSNGGKVSYTGSADTDVEGLGYGDLDFSGTGTYNLLADAAIDGDLTIGSSATLKASNHKMNIAGNWIDNGDFDGGTGLVNFSGPAPQAVSAENGFYDIQTQPGSNVSFNGNVTLARDLNVSSGGVLNIGNVSVYVGRNWNDAGTVNTSVGGAVYFFNAVTHGMVTGANSAFYHLNVNGGTLSVDGASATTTNLVINPGTTFDLNGKVMNLNGSWNNAGGTLTGTGTVMFLGTGTISAEPNFDVVEFKAGGSYTINGSITIAKDFKIYSGTVNAGMNSVYVNGDFYNAGTFSSTGGGSVYLISSSPQNFTPGTDAVFYNINVLGASSYTMQSDAVTTTNFSVDNGTFNLNGKKIYVKQNWNHTAGTLTGTGTVEFIGAAAHNIQAEPNFPEVVINASNTVTLTGNVTSTGVTLTQGTLALGSYTFHVTGDWTNTGGTLDSGTGSVVFNGTSEQTITDEANFKDVTINNTADIVKTSGGVSFLSGGTLTVGGGSSFFASSTVTVYGDTENYGQITVTSGNSLSFNGNLNDSGIIDHNSGAGMVVAGDWTGAGTYNGNGTLTINGGNTQSIRGGLTFNYLRMVKTSGTIATLQGDATTTNLDVINGTLALGANTLSVGGNLVHTGGTLSGGTGLVIFNGGADQNVSGESGLPNVRVDKTGGSLIFLNTTVVNRDLNVVSGNTVSVQGALNVSGTTTNSGILGATVGNTVSFNGDLVNSGTLNNPSGTSFVVYGAWDNAGGTYNGGGTMNIAGAANQTLPADLTFGNLLVDKTGGQLVLGGNVTTTNGILVNSSNIGLLDYNGKIIAVGADYNENSSAPMSVTGSTIKMVGTGAQNITAKGGLDNLIIDKPAGTASLNSSVTTTNVRLQNGTLSLGGHPLYVGGDWQNVGGALSGSGTVYFDGTGQTISGSTTFDGFNKTVVASDTLTFEAGNTQTITGAMTLQGASGNLLNLRSSASGTQWSIDPQGTRTVSYLSVKDSNNANATAIPYGTGSVNAGNNTNWGVDTTPPVITITAPTKASSAAIANTTIRVTDDTAISSSTVSVASSTVGISGLTCVQTTGLQVDCTLSITSSGNLVVDATDAAGNPAVQTSETGYIIDTSLPVITITAPTKSSNATITNTTIHVTDAAAILNTGISVDAASTVVTSGLNCTQTNTTTVDCTINIQTNGSLVIRAVDKAGNAATKAEDNYVITSSSGGGGGGGGGGVGGGITPVVTTYQNLANDPNRAANLANLAKINVAVHQLVKLPDDGKLETQEDSAVYYIGADGKRHAFPNAKVYFTWYNDFSGVKEISAEQLASIPLGANVRYKPGVRMVKFTTDPKVYAVDKGGVLRWVTTEEVAIALYGADWNTKIDDMSDVFYNNYSFGDDIGTASEFNVSQVTGIEQYISNNLGL